MTTNHKPSEECIKKWQKLVESENAFYFARQKLFSTCREQLVALVREGINNPADRTTALGVAALLNTDEKQELFSDLLSLASFGHGLISKAREIIYSLPREWVLANIEKAAEPLLQYDSHEEYQRLLELYIELDSELALRLARRAAEHPNEDIKEAGKHFLKILNPQ